MYIRSTGVLQYVLGTVDYEFACQKWKRTCYITVKEHDLQSFPQIRFHWYKDHTFTDLIQTNNEINLFFLCLTASDLLSK